MRLRLLRCCLVLAALTWGIAGCGVFLSWSTLSAALQGLGAGPLVFDPMLDYWVRMASGAFGLLGGLYLVLLVQPGKHWAMIPWFGGLMLVEGIVLLGHGLRLSLAPWPFYADVGACLVAGAGILWLTGSGKSAAGGNQGSVQE